MATGAGTARLSFAPGSDDTWQLMKALVIHLVPPAALLVSLSKQKKRLPGPSNHLEVHILWISQQKCFEGYENSLQSSHSTSVLHCTVMRAIGQ